MVKGSDSLLMEEIWEDIEGYEGLYQVSNLGRIRSLNRIVPRNKTSVKKTERKHIGVREKQRL